MDIKFILLMTGLFLFTLGYVNQNKYNCNIIPSLDNKQVQDLSKLFYKKDVLLERDPDSEIYDYRISGSDYQKYARGIQEATYKGTSVSGGDNFNFSDDRDEYR